VYNRAQTGNNFSVVDSEDYFVKIIKKNKIRPNGSTSVFYFELSLDILRSLALTLSAPLSFHIVSEFGSSPQFSVSVETCVLLTSDPSFFCKLSFGLHNKIFLSVFPCLSMINIYWLCR
jgi:hypothetical protein